MTDKDLCLRLRNGSRSALNETITRFTPYVGAVAWRVMCPIATREDLEEVVADTFIILWNHRLEIDATSIRAWLAKVAKNKAIDKMRAMKLMVPLSDEEACGTSNVDPEERMIQLDRYTRLWDAVNSLEEPDRTIFLRHYYGNEKIGAIAKAMGMQTSNIKTRLHRGRKRLKELLDEGENE